MAINANMKHHKYLSIILILIYIFDCNYCLNIEGLKKFNYEADIQQIPIKRGEEPLVPIIHVASVYGDEYSCIVPQEEEDSSDKMKVNEKSTDIKVLLKELRDAPCLTKETGWWTFKVCYGRYAEHYHVKDGKIDSYIIKNGVFGSDYDWSNKTKNEEKFQNEKERYHSQYFVNGTECGFFANIPNGVMRSLEVRFFCEEGVEDYLDGDMEPETCRSIFLIRTSRLCSFPELKPLPQKKPNSIPCHPLLNEEQYSNYLKKLNAS